MFQINLTVFTVETIIYTHFATILLLCYLHWFGSDISAYKNTTHKIANLVFHRNCTCAKQGKLAQVRLAILDLLKYWISIVSIYSGGI